MVDVVWEKKEVAGGACVLAKARTVVPITVATHFSGELKRVFNCVFDGQNIIGEPVTFVDPGKIVLTFVVNVVPLSHVIILVTTMVSAAKSSAACHRIYSQFQQR